MFKDRRRNSKKKKEIKKEINECCQQINTYKVTSIKATHVTCYENR